MPVVCFSMHTADFFCVDDLKRSNIMELVHHKTPFLKKSVKEQRGVITGCRNHDE